jgi:DNA invertase Pin-like site-specific DNA recombinase
MIATRRPHPRQRQASVDRRQSTPGQGDRHRERPERPYALADRAVDLGWERGQVVLLEQALGQRGTTTPGRDDFHRLMAAVGLGEVGAVCALAAARFSRSPADGHRRLALCAVTDPLVVDQEGVAAPTAGNDRVRLGFQGTWSHTALHALRLRRHGANRHQAHHGERRCHPPTGSIDDPAGALVLAPTSAWWPRSTCAASRSPPGGARMASCASSPPSTAPFPGAWGPLGPMAACPGGRSAAAACGPAATTPPRRGLRSMAGGAARRWWWPDRSSGCVPCNAPKRSGWWSSRTRTPPLAAGSTTGRTSGSEPATAPTCPARTVRAHPGRGQRCCPASGGVAGVAGA